MAYEGASGRAASGQAGLGDADRDRGWSSATRSRRSEPASAIGGARGHGPVQRARSGVSNLNRLRGCASVRYEGEAELSGKVVEERRARCRYGQRDRDGHFDGGIGVVGNHDLPRVSASGQVAGGYDSRNGEGCVAAGIARGRD